MIPFLSGLVLWTLLEYLLHRFVFHERWLGASASAEHLEHHARVDWFVPWRSKLRLAAIVLGTGRVNGAYDHDQPAPTCHSCHPDWTSGDALLEAMSGAHDEHVGDLACADCHGDVVDSRNDVVAPELHVDGIVELRFPDGFTSDGSTCTGTCHGEVHAGRRW